MKKISGLLIAVLIITGLSSCSKSDSFVLYFAVNETASSFDPQIASGSTTKNIVYNCFEGLFAKAADGTVSPAAAESYTVSPDGLTYTFSLRANSMWHLTKNAQDALADKLPSDFDIRVTAYDFEFALKRACTPATGAKDADKLINISGVAEALRGEASPDSIGVRALSDYVLEIKLSCAQTDFTEVLTYPVAMPCNKTFFNACGGRYGLLIKYFLSNGPYYLSRFDETSYRLNKSSDYTGEFKANADYVWLYYKADNASTVSAIDESGYTGAFLDSEGLTALKSVKDMNVTEIKNGVYSFLFNSGSEVLSNSAIRQAFMYATDTASVAENAKKRAAFSPVPEAVENFSGYTESRYNEAMASQALSEGLAQAGLDSVSVSLTADEKYTDVLKKQLQEWQRILGIKFTVTLNLVSSSELAAKLSSGAYEIILAPLTTSSESAYEYFLGFSSYSTSEKPFFTSEEYDSLVKTLACTSGSEKTEAAASLENILLSEAFVLPVWSESLYLVTSKSVSGVISGTDRSQLYYNYAVSTDT